MINLLVSHTLETNVIINHIFFIFYLVKISLRMDLSCNNNKNKNSDNNRL